MSVLILEPTLNFSTRLVAAQYSLFASACMIVFVGVKYGSWNSGNRMQVWAKVADH
jgi:hypothetical protein